MSLLDSFRPKWKHNDPEVRAEAVRELEDATALLDVARGDADASIRRLAVRKLDDPRLLAEIGAGDADEGVRELALGRARELRLAGANGRDEEKARVLLADLATVTRNVMAMAHSPETTFVLYPKFTPLQERAFQLLGTEVSL